jgi:3-hydroxybutyryl-CoA dehydrogenase
MAENSVAILGANRLAGELAELCEQKGIPSALASEARVLPPGASLVIETSTLDCAAKKMLLEKLDDSLPAATVILSSCLGAAVTHSSASLKRPERVVGFATFYPLAERKLVELAAGLRTAQEAAQRAQEIFKAMGKETVLVKDTAGLNFPRILSLIINEAARALEEGVASAEEIDVAMRLGVNYPQGPLKWADRIGLDEVLAVLQGLHAETGDDRYRAAPLLRKLVSAGFAGEIAGRGFYCYTDSGGKP